MATIGIFGGMGPQASTKLCELIVQKALDNSLSRQDTDVPEIVLLSVPVPNFVSNKTNMGIAKAMLVNRVKLFEQARCDVAGIACNTAHLLLPEIQIASSVPFVSLPHLVAQRIRDNEFKRVGLLGSPNTLQSTLFDEAITDAILVRPSQRLIKLTALNIHKQLKGVITAQERTRFKLAVRRFTATNHLDAVILGCTELPLVFGPTNNKKIIDTLDVLAEGLLQSSISGITLR